MEPEKNEQKEPEYAFVKERIIVERPPKKAGFFKRLLAALFLGVVFGGVSAVVFVVALPYLQEYFHHPEIPGNNSGGDDDRVNIPLDDETGESTTTNTDQTTETTTDKQQTDITPTTSTEDTTSPVELQCLTEEDVKKLIDEALEGNGFIIADYKALYAALSGVVTKVNRSIVAVTTTNTGIDILERSYEVVETTSGIIYSITENDVYIVTTYAEVEDAESIKVSFYGGIECEANILSEDISSNIAVICIEKSSIDNSTLSRIQAVTLGNSYAVNTGDPIIVVGNPMGYMYTMSYGIVTATTQNFLKQIDAHYRVINTNVVKSRGGNGFLINLDGELVGILFDEDEESDSVETVDICAAAAISDLKRRLGMISNNEPIPYFGIAGEDMVGDDEASPQGIYILQTDIDSPAYNAGILNGDIIVGMSDMDNMSMKSLRNFLEASSPGDVVTVKVMREGKEGYNEMDFEVVLGKN